MTEGSRAIQRLRERGGMGGLGSNMALGPGWGLRDGGGGVLLAGEVDAGGLAVEVLGDETLRDIARDLVGTVGNNVAIDWILHESVHAHLRVLVRRILDRYGYAPDEQEKATRMVFEQAEAQSEGWAVA